MSSSDSDTDSNQDFNHHIISSDSDYVTSDEERDDDETKGDLNPLTRSDYDSDDSYIASELDEEEFIETDED